MPRTRTTVTTTPRELGWEDFRRQAILVAMRGDRSVVEDLIATMSTILTHRASSGLEMLAKTGVSASVPPVPPATTTTTPAPTPHEGSRDVPPVNEATPLGTPRRRRRRGMPETVAPLTVGSEVAPLTVGASPEPADDPGEAPLPYVDPAFDPAASESGL